MESNDMVSSWSDTVERDLQRLQLEEEFSDFRNTFSHNMDQLQMQLSKKTLHECDSKEYFRVLKKQVKRFFNS
ncbi:hypothetical protein Tco_1400579 [Tanacetum coccineum]